MADAAEESSGLSIFVPLGFLAMFIWTLSWGSSLLHVLRGSQQQSDENEAAKQQQAEQQQGNSKKGKKKDNSTKGKEALPAPVVDKPAPPHVRRTLILAAAWIAFMLYATMSGGLGTVGDDVFDPYKILNIPQTASKSDIKKVYRTLSLDFHPDRLAGKPEAERLLAESQFVKISKAYKTLTDEEAMNNWLTYGHPDGPRSISVEFGIPAWMKKKENAGIVLLMYLGVFAGVGWLIKNQFSSVFGDEDEKKD